MSEAPLSPFHPPAGLPFHFALSLGEVALWLLFLILLGWGIYTLVAIYHWLKFSHAAAVAYPAIGVHLAVSAVLILYAISGLL